MKYQLLCGDALSVLKTLDSESVQCVVTSPPYFGLRDYGIVNQLGMENTVKEYVLKLVEIFTEAKRVLKCDGTIWINLGDSYSSGGNGGGSGKQRTNKGSLIGPKATPGYKIKNLIGVPWHVAFALQEDGWYLRSDIIWAKPNPMPESVTDRPTKSHEYIFLLSKSAKYYYDAKAIKEQAMPDTSIRDRDNTKLNNTPGRTKEGGLKTNGYETRNKRDVWTVPTSPYPEAHFATYPPKLIEPCILAGSRPGDIVLDPFNGSGTTGQASLENQRKYIGIELNPEYIKLSEKRLSVINVKLL